MASDGVHRLVPLLSLLLMYFSFGETLSIVSPVHHALLYKDEVKILLLYHEKGKKIVLSQKWAFFFSSWDNEEGGAD